MTTASGNSLSVGLRYFSIFELNDAGYPAATDENPYYGLQDGSERAFQLNVPAPRKFTFAGRDVAIGTDYLAPLDAMEGSIAFSAANLVLSGILGGIQTTTHAEGVLLPIATDRAGHEPVVAAYLYQQALDRDSQLRFWRSFIFPRVKMIYRPAGMGENPEQVTYQMGMSPSKYHLWGTQLTMAADKCKTAQGFEMMTEFEPVFVSFIGDGVTTQFDFDTDIPSVSTAKIAVWVDGVRQWDYIPNYTPSVTGIVFDTPPVLGANIFVKYEKE